MNRQLSTRVGNFYTDIERKFSNVYQYPVIDECAKKDSMISFSDVLTRFTPIITHQEKLL